MTMVGETGDQLIDGAVGSKTKYQDLIELFSKLNPSAEEFVPFRKPDPRLSADAPSFDFYSSNNIKDSRSDGSSTNPQPNRRRRNGYNQGRKKINYRNHDGQIRRTVSLKRPLLNYSSTVVKLIFERKNMKTTWLKFHKQSLRLRNLSL